MGDDEVLDAIEPRLLRVLVALADEGTFTDAAIRLGISQPAVSRALARFEAVLGVQLVQRTTRSLRLTPAGEHCYAAATQALAALESVVAAAHGHARPLRLGHTWAALGPWTTAVLRTWRERHPDVPLEVRRVDDRTAGLRGRLVDVAVRRGPVSESGVHVVPVLKEGRLAAVPADSPLAARRDLTLTDLSGEVVVLSPATGTTTLDLWPPEARPERVLEVTNTDEWLMAIAAGDAVGVTPASTAAQHTHPAVRFVPLSGVPAVTVSLVWPEVGAHPSVEDLLAVVRECLPR
jgi:DNA-binding transcriptional LysR family regulator